MHFTREQRDSWEETTRDSPFNRWLKSRTRDHTGKLDLAALRSLAGEYGIDATAYVHLNPGQQRMNIGNRLRKLVPSSIIMNVGPPSAMPLAPSLPITAASPSLGRRAARAGPNRLPPNISDRELMRLYGAVVDELRARKIVRTGNAPLGDYAEYLFAKAFNWTLAGNSSSGHDAKDANGLRFQVKARRLRKNAPGERQLGVIRALPDAKFDTLAAVLFDANFEVYRAALIPQDIVLKRSSYISHVNGWRLMLGDTVWAEEGVQDVTLVLRTAAEEDRRSLEASAAAEIKPSPMPPVALMRRLKNAINWPR